MKKALMFLVLAAVLAGGVFAQTEKTGFIKSTFSFGFLVHTINDKAEVPGVVPYQNYPYWRYGTVLRDIKYEFGYAALGMDVDFVHSTGITLGIQSLFGFNTDDDDPDFLVFPFGAGYTYSADKWCAGAKFMIVPAVAKGNTGVGFDLNGTFWLTETLGLTGIMDIYFGQYDDLSYVTNEIYTVTWSSFSMRAGISLKF